MDYANLIAIDTHTHLEVSCRNPFHNYGDTQMETQRRNLLRLALASADTSHAGSLFLARAQSMESARILSGFAPGGSVGTPSTYSNRFTACTGARRNVNA